MKSTSMDKRQACDKRDLAEARHLMKSTIRFMQACDKRDLAEARHFWEADL